MAEWAITTDVTGRWIGADVPTDLVLISQLIDDAEMLVVAEFPDMAERVVDDPSMIGRVRMVVARMVIRAMRNPSGVRQMQETTGPFSGSVTFGGDAPGALVLSDEDRDLLAGRAGGRPRAFTINTTPEPVDLDPPWLGQTTL